MTMISDNDRRIDLILKKYNGGGLTNDEERELTDLQSRMSAYFEQNYPRDTTRLDELEKKVYASGS